MDHEHLKYITRMDPEMLRAVMDDYGEDIWNYAFFLTRDTQLADDIAQDTFIKMFYRIETFRGQASFKTWLMTIARNTAFRYQRQTFLRKVTLVAAIRNRQVTRSTETEYIERQQVDIIWRHILSLPQKYREVLVLDLRYELPIREIAKLLRISDGTVKSRLHRARKKIQHLLKEDDER